MLSSHHLLRLLGLSCDFSWHFFDTNPQLSRQGLPSTATDEELWWRGFGIASVYVISYSTSISAECRLDTTWMHLD